MVLKGKRRSVEFSDPDRMANEYWDLFLYAINNNHDSDSVMTGAYEDGWVGRNLNIKVAPSSSPQTLEIKFLAPEWVPQPSLSVQVITDGNRLYDELMIYRGSNAVLSFPIEQKGGYFKIRVAPTFVPAFTGHGNDQRELSAMLQQCGIARSNGEYVQLFPRKIPV
jgi:hypothetical protein